MNADLLKRIAAYKAKIKFSFLSSPAFKPYSFQREFLDATSTHLAVCLKAGNRVGKSWIAMSAVAMHACGFYPSWYKGWRSSRPTTCWCAGQSFTTVRASLQSLLLGRIGDPKDYGAHLLPRDSIIKTIPRPNVPGAISSIEVKHRSGGVSVIEFKSFETGLSAFLAADVDFISLDEEDATDGEAFLTQSLVRVLSRQGRVILTLTPEHGPTALIRRFNHPTKDLFLVRASWDGAPHLNQAAMDATIALLPEHERALRKFGEEIRGSGAVFSFPRETIACKPFSIPADWRRVCAVDLGSTGTTSAVWLAIDPRNQDRSEEHTSELQSHSFISYAVFCL